MTLDTQMLPDHAINSAAGKFIAAVTNRVEMNARLKQRFEEAGSPALQRRLYGLIRKMNDGIETRVKIAEMLARVSLDAGMTRDLLRNVLPQAVLGTPGEEGFKRNDAPVMASLCAAPPQKKPRP